jgi:glutaconate CoA-transferase subunit A
MVDGVVERAGAAHFTECPPDYKRDETFQREYAASAATPDAWTAFRSEWLDMSEEDYQGKVAARP